MELKSFRVRDFRSVHDSGDIAVDRVTALIGVNESGKTNLLLPLWKLNPAREGEIQPTSDYPKKLFGAIRAKPDAYCFIEAEFATGSLAQELATLTGESAEALDRVIVYKYFSSRIRIEFPDCKLKRTVAAKDIQDALRTAENDIRTASPLEGEETVRDKLLHCLKEAHNIPSPAEVPLAQLRALRETLEAHTPPDSPENSTILPRFSQVVDTLDRMITSISKPEPGTVASVVAAVKNNMPKFVYYSNYGNLDSEIYLPHVVQNLKREDLGAKESAKARTLRVLFKFVQLSPDEILALGQEFKDPKAPDRPPTEVEVASVGEKKRERSILLQSAGTTLTQKFREWWKQGDYRFRFDADGNHFRIWVADHRRPEEIELESRSTGLQWFLSFYLIFLVESEESHQNAVLLLDEPGLSLHPLAQRDLSRFFDGLSETNSIIYTTHSPFLVDADRLDRARKVYVSDDGTTKATDNLRDGHGGKDQAGAAYAVHSALNLSVAESLLLGCQAVVVEGPSDQHYLTSIKTLLIRSGRILPKRELVFPPSGGARTARMVASILTGRDESLPFVLLDDDEQGRKMSKEMATSLYHGAPDRLLNERDYVGFEGAEIEDLFPTRIIAEAVDRLHRAGDSEQDFSLTAMPGLPIVPQIEKWAAKNGLDLPRGWKVPLSRRVKQQVLALSIGDLDPAVVKTWVNVFTAFEPSP